MKPVILAILILSPLSLTAMTKADLENQLNRYWDNNAQEVEDIFHRLENRNIAPGLLEHNRGNYHYSQGRFQEASEYYESAASLLRRPGKQAENAYNLANCYAALAESAEEDESLELQERAIQSYLDTLQIRPNHMDASHNLELLLREQEDQEDQGSGNQQENDQEDQEQQDQQENPQDQEEQSEEQDEQQNERSFGQNGQNQEEPTPQDFLNQEEQRREQDPENSSTTGRIFEVDRDW